MNRGNVVRAPSTPSQPSSSHLLFLNHDATSTAVGTQTREREKRRRGRPTTAASPAMEAATALVWSDELQSIWFG
ncbi:hypothetical protein Hanom_Chr12g01118441 [Helianthus anomalus]